MVAEYRLLQDIAQGEHFGSVGGAVVFAARETANDRRRAGATTSDQRAVRVQQLKLGLFSLNGDGGFTVTRAPERWRADWSDIVDFAKLADRAGIEFIQPIARWNGHDGAMDVRTRCFATFTFAAAAAAGRIAAI